MSQTSENNKRIAKNTMFLYFRMIIIMGVSLFTSRVILKALGVTDYGVYNVVGGVVAMMGMLNSAMAVASQRYLTFELGRKDYARLKTVFSVSFSIYLLLALIFVILAETVGLWFLNAKLVIPADRMVAANWIYQFSIIAVISSLLTNPYNASIIAHEKMNAFAYVSILEGILKLGVAYLVYVFAYDKLIVYGAGIMLVSLIITAIYRQYCIVKFEECKYRWVWDKALFKELSTYSGWNLFSSVTNMASGQGVNILLNLFFGPVVNAARGLAVQIEAAIHQFFTNFYTATRPQITKYYAEGNLNNMFDLVIRSSRFSFYLMLFVAMPILLETEFVVQLWLGQVPEYVVIFTRLIILDGIINAMATPLMTTAHATGRIALYQFVLGTMAALNVPIIYLLFRWGFSPYYAFYTMIIISIIKTIARLWLVKRLINFPIMKYCKNVLFVSVGIGLLSMVLPLLIKMQLPLEGIIHFIVISIISVISSISVIYFIGMTKSERTYVKKFISEKMKLNQI